jgi:hypothetical protein
MVKKAVLRGGLDWLIGIGSLAFPGVGPLFIAAGPIVAALGGAAGSTTDEQLRESPSQPTASTNGPNACPLCWRTKRR